MIRRIALITIGVIMSGFGIFFFHHAAKADGLFAGGNGDWDDPYLVSTCQELQNMNDPSVVGSDSLFKLTRDIDCTMSGSFNGGEGFIPIGASGNEGVFTGGLDGNHKTIYGLVINQPDAPYSGLFSAFGDSIVQNVTLSGGSVTGAGYVGGIVGTMYGSLIIGSSVENMTITGSSTGDNYGPIPDSVGAIAGVVAIDPVVGVIPSLDIDSSEATVIGMTDENDTLSAGGIVGTMLGATAKDSYSTSTVTGGTFIGGFAGAMVSSGGIVENSDLPSLLTTSYSSGAVSGDALSIGGLVGTIFSDSDDIYISNSFTTSPVSADFDQAAVLGGYEDEDDFNPVDPDTVYYDETATNEPYCTGNDSDTSCIPVNTGNDGDSTDSTYFLGNDTNPPLNDFSTSTWAFSSGQLPTLQAGPDFIAQDGGGATMISSCSDFENINNNPSGSYELTQDLDCRGEANNIVVGGGDNPYFTGSFNGGGHTIQVDIEGYTPNGAGLFGFIDGADIHDLKVTGTVQGGAYIGGIVGVSYGNSTLERVSFIGILGGDYPIGGIAGQLYGTLSDSYASVDVPNGSQIGGLVGVMNNAAEIERSYATGDISGSNIGGLVGEIDISDTPAQIVDSFSSVALHPGDGAAGGIVGTFPGDPTTVFTDDLWDGSRSGVSSCGGDAQANGDATYSGGDGLCTIENADGDDGGYFRANDTNSPFGNWDFEGTWATTTTESNDGYPALQALDNDTGGIDELPQDINSCADFENIANDMSGTYELRQNLDCSGEGENMSIGDITDPNFFSGTFDGNGFTIQVSRDSNGDSTGGLFNATKGATIRNIKVTGTVSGGDTTGGLVGYAYDGTTISDAVFEGTVTGGQDVGGLVGDLRGGSSIADSYTSAVVSGTRVGGLVGYAEQGATVARTYSSGSVIGEFVGSLIGQVDDSEGVASTTDSFGAATILNDSSGLGGGIASTISETDASIDMSDNYWDINRTQASLCTNANIGSTPYAGATGVCEGVDATGTDANYFRANDTNGPFSAWNFSSVWATTTTDGGGYGYPALRAINDDTGGADVPLPYHYAAGDGSSGNPYQIDSCAGIVAMNDYLSSSFILATSSLDCSGEGNDIIVGNGNNPFTGTFDGQEGSIAISIDATSSQDYLGLFGSVSGGTIENLTLTGSVEAEQGGSYIGMLAGDVYDNATISNIHVTADVTGLGDPDGIYNLGGIVGDLEGSTVNNVQSSGSVTGADDTGGAFGFMGCQAQISNSHSSATVTGRNYLGGFAGFDGCEGPGTNTTNSYATGNVTGDDYLGGFTGDAIGVDYEGIYATGDVAGTGDEVGGLIGEYDAYGVGIVLHAHATGTVQGQNYVGGLIGDMGNSATVSQSYATGNVQSTGDDTGGLVGSISSSIIRDSYTRSTVMAQGNSEGGFFGISSGENLISTSYSTGAVLGSGDDVGGFAGQFDDSDGVYDSFWDAATAGQAAGCGNTNSSCSGIESTSTQEMKSSGLFTDAGWNFDTIWSIDGGTNDGYPYLLGGDDIVFTRPNTGNPVESIQGTNQFVGGGVAQGWHADDNYWSYTLPFAFTFYGQQYTTVYVDSNGYLSFSDANGMGSYNQSLSTEAQSLGVPIIAAMENDLTTDQGAGSGDGDIYVTDNGDGKVIFRWKAYEYDNQNNQENFEIVLNSDSTFEINYGDQTTPNVNPVNAGVADGRGDYATSTYDQNTDFNDVDSSLWNWPTGTNAGVNGQSGDDSGDDSSSTPPAPTIHPESSVSGQSNDNGSISTNTSQSELISSLQAELATLEAKLEALLGKGTPPSASLASTMTRDLKLGMSGADVKALQVYLNAHGSIIAKTGSGSPGSESTYFGILTQKALAKWQAAHNVNPASGYFGPLTRAAMGVK